MPFGMTKRRQVVGEKSKKKRKKTNQEIKKKNYSLMQHGTNHHARPIPDFLFNFSFILRLHLYRGTIIHHMPKRRAFVGNRWSRGGPPIQRNCNVPSPTVQGNFEKGYVPMVVMVVLMCLQFLWGRVPYSQGHRCRLSSDG